MAESKFRSILNTIYQEPQGITVVDGNWKTGKTDFTLHLYELLKEMGLINECAGNIRIYKDRECEQPTEEQIKYIDNFLNLKAWMFSNLHRKMFIFDEAMKAAPSKKAMTLLNAEWQKVIPELSKGKVHLFALTQEESMTEKIFMHRTFNIAKWTKIMLPPRHPQYRKLVKVSSKLLKENIKFRNISKTNLNFNPNLSALWTLEPMGNSAINESSLEIRVAYAYVNGTSIFKMPDVFPEITHVQQAKRLLKAGIKSLFDISHFTGDSSGIIAQWKGEE